MPIVDLCIVGLIWIRKAYMLPLPVKYEIQGMEMYTRHVQITSYCLIGCAAFLIPAEMAQRCAWSYWLFCFVSQVKSS